MPLFTVRTFQDRKVQQTREVEAPDAQQAAEKACGMALAVRGHQQQLRAVVWEFRARNAERLMFYEAG
jgi:hypothetical protein